MLFTAFSLYGQQQPNYNRFQYHKYKWKVFHTKAFHIYFPAGYDSACSVIAAELPFAIKKVKHNIGTALLEEPNVIVYPSVDQLYESNIGLYETEQHTLPTFITKGNRAVVFYTGQYSKLKEQLYEALTRSIWEAQMKNDVSSQAKGTTLGDDIPFWYKEGAIRYFATGWPIAAEDALRISFEQRNFRNWQECISYQPSLSGQAFCYFLNEQYYPQASMQLFSQLKRKKNLARSIRFIVKKPIDSILQECYQFYHNRFQHTDTGQGGIETAIPHKKGIVRNISISPDGNNIAYVVYRKNTRYVYLYDRKTAKIEKLTRYLLPPWINDYSVDIYPLLKWQDKNILLVTLPVKGKVTIKRFFATGGQLESFQLPGADGVSSVQLIEKDKYLLSAYRKGQSDIVSYDAIKEKYQPFTNDRYDDGIAILGMKNQPIFLSTRPINEKDTNILFQGIYKWENEKLSAIVADTIPFSKWDKPQLLQNGNILATTTQSGAEEMVIVGTGTDHGFYRPYEYISDKSEISFYKSDNDSIRLSTFNISDWLNDSQSPDTGLTPWLADFRKRAAKEAAIDSMLRKAKDDNPSFLEGVLVAKDAKQRSLEREDSIRKSQQYNAKNIKPYVLQLHSAYFSAKINNDYFINRYQPYANYQGQFKFPEVGGMLQGGLTDLFENHHVNIAFRLPAGSEGSDFFFRYENTARKLDWGLAYFRKVESLNADPKRNWVDENGNPYPSAAKIKTHYYELSFHYPITYYLSVDLSEAVRNDRTIFLATDRYSLKFEDIKGLWSITSLTITQDKVKPTIPLLNRGYKIKGTVDIFQPLSGSSLGTATGTGVQLTYHQPLYSYITLVAQAKAGYSGGLNKVLYNLAGIDNNVTVRFDSTVQHPQAAPYVFQTLVTPLRGYLQNKLYGNEYLLFNADVYFPLFQTLIPLETPLQSINLLQLGLFSDLATAKETWQKPTVNNGWLWSYGICAKTSLAGYPIRFDIAWPGALNRKPVWYFSLNLK